MYSVIWTSIYPIGYVVVILGQRTKEKENKYNTFSNNQCNMFKLVFPLLTFSYGIKTVKGVNRLSGPGLEAKDFPGMMQGGGKWPGRWGYL